MFPILFLSGRSEFDNRKQLGSNSPVAISPSKVCDAESQFFKVDLWKPVNWQMCPGLYKVTGD